MRELIYLSERKLRQFDLPKARWNPLRRVREVSAKVPLDLGEVKLALADASGSAVPNLDVVIDQIERSARSSKWYVDDRVMPGSWVQFDTPLNYARVGESDFLNPDSVLQSDALVFLEPRHEPTDGNDIKTRLLLHGSASHLVGGNRTRPSNAGLSPSFGPEFFAMLGRCVPGDRLPGDLAETLIQQLDRSHGPSTAAWMAGYARVTLRTRIDTRIYDHDYWKRTGQSRYQSQYQTLITASPLFVCYSTEYSEDS